MLEMLSDVVTLCSAIYTLRGTVKANKEQANLLCDRVHSVHGSLEQIKVFSEQLQTHMNQLKLLLNDIHKFLNKFRDTGWFKRVCKSSNFSDQFKEYSDRISQLISQVMLGIAVQTNLPKPYGDIDRQAAKADLLIIKNNEDVLLEIERMSRHQDTFLTDELAKLRVFQEKGLYALADKSHSDAIAIRDKIESMRQQLAQRDERFINKVSEIGAGIQQLDENVQRGLDIQKIIQLEIAALRSTLLGQQKPSTFQKIDTGLLIDFSSLTLEKNPLIKHERDLIYLAKYRSEQVIVKLFQMMSVSVKNEFENEVLTQSNLHSEHIVRIFGICEVHGHESQGIIVQEHMPHGNLEDYLTEHKPSDEQRLQLIKQITKGIRHIHAGSIIHADLNPGNILVDRHQEAKISDLGSSRQASMSVSQMLAKVENHQYSPPEYYKKTAKLTHASDVYSWAILAIYITTNKQPEVDSDHLIQQTWLSSLEAKFHPELYQLICSSLHLVPSRRPPIEKIDDAVTRIQLRPPSPSAEEYYNKGRTHVKADQYEQAYSCYHRSAEKGYVKALTNLGLFKINGHGTAQHTSDGIKYLADAVERKHNRACYVLAELYFTGNNGVKIDYEKAADLYQKAIDYGLNSSDIKNQLDRCHQELLKASQTRTAKLPLSTSGM